MHQLKDRLARTRAKSKEIITVCYQFRLGSHNCTLSLFNGSANYELKVKTLCVN